MTTLTRPVAKRQTLVPLAALSVVVTIGFTILGVTHENGHSFDWGQFLVVVALMAVTTAIVFGLVVPRGIANGTSGRSGLVMAVLALLLLVPAFWAGIVPALSLGAVASGQGGRSAERFSKLAAASFALGLLGIVGYVAIYLGDYLTHH